jgi:hypothetical protein
VNGVVPASEAEEHEEDTQLALTDLEDYIRSKKDAPDGFKKEYWVKWMLNLCKNECAYFRLLHILEIAQRNLRQMRGRQRTRQQSEEQICQHQTM